MAKIYWFCGHEQFQPEVLVRHAQLAEESGFDGVMVSEHFHPWVHDQGASGFAFATIAAMAQVTSNVHFMTAVTTPLFRHHPAVVAQAAATLDRLSGGRFELGVGTGENINEGPLGYTFPSYRERSERMREAIIIMRRLLDGEKVNFDGRHYRTEAAKLYSPPVSRVPIYLAAGGPKSATLAGEIADGVIVSVKEVPEALEKVVTPARKAAGSKPFAVIANHWSVYAQNDEEAWQALGPWRGLRAPSRATAIDPEHLQREADSLPRHEILGRYTLVKSADEFIEAYSPLINQLGADIIGIQSTSINQEKLIHMVGREVVPALKQLSKEVV